MRSYLTFHMRPKPMPSEKPVTISLTNDTFFEFPSFVNIWVARMTCELPDILTILESKGLGICSCATVASASSYC